MAGIVISHADETDFSRPQKRAVLRDARLSWAARGFFVFG